MSETSGAGVTDADGPRPLVGFVGLGRMGRPMAQNLAAAGFPLVVHDADAERTARFASEHGCVAADSASSFAGAEVVVTMLPDDRAVRDAILLWDGGIAAALARRAVVVDMSSSNPDGTKSLGGELAPLGIGLVDAPVSGGVPRAEAGTLTLMIGSDDDAAVERVRPALEVLGERVFRTGPLGAGHAMKALNNLVGGATYAVVAEALAVGQRYGLAPGTMVDVMNASTGRSFNTEHVFGEHVVQGRYATGFALGLLAKDVSIAAALAGASGVDAPVCELENRCWADAASSLGAEADHSEAHKSWWPGG